MSVQNRIQRCDRVIIERVKSGKMLPMISNRLHNDLYLGKHSEMVADYARQRDLEFMADKEIATLAQFSCTMGQSSDDLEEKLSYLEYISGRLLKLASEQKVPQNLLDDASEQVNSEPFSAIARQLGYYPKICSDPEDSVDPLLTLASLDLPIYLTTSYHDFIEDALKAVGKTPVKMVCQWNAEEGEPPESINCKPTVESPIVFHLHGHDSSPDSMVFSEDDHLKLMIAISSDKENVIIHPRIRRALAESSLMLLGYELNEWEFRSLFWSLIQPRQQKKKSVCELQLNYSEHEQKFFQHYMKQVECGVFWGEFGDYIRAIDKALNP